MLRSRCTSRHFSTRRFDLELLGGCWSRQGFQAFLLSECNVALAGWVEQQKETVYQETEEGQACCVLASLKGSASRPAIPSFFQFNVCALDNKSSFEHLRLQR